MNCDEAQDSLKKRDEDLEQLKSKLVEDERRFDDQLRSLELQQNSKVN